MTDRVNPADPVLAISTNEKVGRLYHKPGFVLPEKLSPEKIKSLVVSGDLMPSTTNIISVRSSPFLIPWATRLVAKEMVDFAKKNPTKLIPRIKANPWGAINYFKEAATRERDFWGNQGTKIHFMCELLAQGTDISHYLLTDYEKKSINQFKAWLDEFQPKYNYLEITGFGKTEDQLGYAHTSDFIADIKGKKIIGDYKCVTDDTLVLMENGSHKPASELKLGDQVVAWTAKLGLHVAPISYVGDNGYQKVATVATSSGQKITSTLNHPFWSSKKSQKMTWTVAEDLNVGDELYVALGWNYSPHRVSISWPYRKNLSPYVLGVLWSLRNFSKQDWSTETFISLPNISRPELREELSEMGFQFNRKGQMNLKSGLAKLAHKNKITLEEVFSLINVETLPTFVYGADDNHLVAFMAGIKEVFSNKEIYTDELFVVFSTNQALSNLQQLYLNSGQAAVLNHDKKSNLSYLKIPFANKDTIFAYGPTATKITSITITEEKEHTIALEVENSHTHVTGGLITHNTNRSGLHVDVALQLAANARGNELAVDNKTLIPAPHVDAAVGIHISPQGVEMVEIDISDNIWEIFCSLRRVWDFHAFEGKLLNKKGVMLRKIETLNDL